MTVKLTRKQANAIEKIKEEQRKRIETIKAYPNLYHVENWEQSLLELEADDFQSALFDGYEVEPELHCGNWVVVTASGIEMDRPEKVVEVSNYGVKTENFRHVGNDCIRHATESEIKQEKERRFWAEHGRNPNEVKEGDIIMNADGGVFISACTQILSGKHNVVCFVEDRLDVNTND